VIIGYEFLLGTLEKYKEMAVAFPEQFSTYESGDKRGLLSCRLVSLRWQLNCGGGYGGRRSLVNLRSKEWNLATMDIRLRDVNRARRLRENKRRHRQRQKEYTAELESKLRHLQSEGIKATYEV
jgi:hypothetical protein